MKYKREEFFVDVALIGSREVDKDWIQSDRECHLRTFEKIKQNITYKELLTADDRFLLLRGIAGIGKTCLLDYLMFQWAVGKLWNGNDNQPHFDFLFRFNCRELNLYQDNVLSVEELFKCRYPSIFCHICFKDLVKRAENVLIILDGLDEFFDIDDILRNPFFPVSTKAPVAAVIQTMLNGCFPDCKRIVAGRPESVSTIYSCWGREIKMKCADIVGFSDEMIHRYIDKFSSNAKTLQQKIKESHHLNTMSHIPVYRWIICSIFEEDMMFPVPETITELYIWAFTLFIREHYRNQQFSEMSLSLVDLLQEEITQEILNAASCLSYQMIMNKKVIFTKADVEALGYSGNIILEENAGFIVKAKRNHVEGTIYQFGHLTLQEFFCAVYCFTNDIPFQNSFTHNRSLYVVAPIISGFQGATIENSKSSDVIKCFVKQLAKIKEKSVLLIEELAKSMPRNFGCDESFYCFITCLFEFQNVMPKTVIEMLPAMGEMQLIRVVDIKHSHMLEYFIHFILQLYHVQTNPYPKAYCYHKKGLWSLRISNLEISEEQLVSASEIIFKLSALEIIDTELKGTNGLAAISDSIVSSHKKAKHKRKGIHLAKLAVINCNLTHKQLASLSSALPFLSEVDLSRNEQIGIQGYRELVEAVVKSIEEAAQVGRCINLQKLSLRSCHITAEKLIALSVVLPFITEVDLSGNEEIGMQGYSELVKVILKSNEEAAQNGKFVKLQKLCIKVCDITSDELTALSPGLPFIKEVDLSQNKQIGMQGYSELAKAIVKADEKAAQKGKCINLQKLSLYNCGITSDELTALSPGLPFINEVNLSGNNQIGMQGYSELVKAIVKADEEAAQKGKDISLQKLSLWNYGITSDELTALSEALPLINEVDLSGNNQIGMQGYSEFAKAIVKADKEAAQKGKYINLQKLRLYNCGITTEELIALSPALAFINEVHLSLNKQMGTQGYSGLVKAIVKANEEASRKGRNLNLQKLRFLDCGVTTDELTALSPGLPFINEVDLSRNKQMGRQGYSELVKNIVKSYEEGAEKGNYLNLQKLRLLDCGITADELNALSPALPFLPEVDLSKNKQMEMQGYSELVKVIVKANKEASQKGKCIKLHKLSLRSCGITTKELIALSPALPCINEVDLSGNEQMEQQGYSELVKCIVKAAQKVKRINLLKLDLCNCGITTQKLIALSPAVPFIHELNLSRNPQMGLQGYTELVKVVLKANEEAGEKGNRVNLQKLRLYNCGITTEELIALSPALPFINEVYLSLNNQMGTQGYSELVRVIVKANEEASQKGKSLNLRKLRLLDCGIFIDELTALLPAIPYINEVDLSRNKQIGMQGYSELVKVIVKFNEGAAQKGECFNLQKLRLLDCGITIDELTALSPGLPLINEVDLSGNKLMGMQGYSELVKVIVKASEEAAQKGMRINLQKLTLRGCGIATEELIALSPALPFIDEVDLSGNAQMGPQGYSELVKVIFKASEEAAQDGRHINLQKLDLYNCGITTEN